MTSSPAPAGSGSSPLTSLRTTVGALLVSPVVLVGVVALVLWPEREPYPVWAIPAAVILVALGFLAAQLFGYPRRPVTGKTPQERGRKSRARFTTETFTRFVLTEAPVLIAVVLSFVLTSPFPLFAAASFGIVSMAWHTWPGERRIAEAEERYSADGQPAYLREALEGHPVPDA